MPVGAHAQFSADSQTNIISGVTNSASIYCVGSNTSFNVLLIQNGGMLSNDAACVGCTVTSSNNTAVVTDEGSIWQTAYLYPYQFGLTVGYRSQGNRLVISNGAQIVFYFAEIGNTAKSNTVWVTGTNTSWRGAAELSVGILGAGTGAPIEDNSLLVSSGARVEFASIVVGLYSTRSSLTVSNGARTSSTSLTIGSDYGYDCRGLITGTGSVCETEALIVGETGTGNVLVVENGAALQSGSGVIGWFDPYGVPGGNNQVLITGAGSVWSNRHELLVGNETSSNSLVIVEGSVQARNMVVGGTRRALNNSVRVDSGCLVVTDSGAGRIIVGQAGQGRLVLHGGAVTTDTLVLTNGSNSTMQFNSGLLSSQATVVSNAVLFCIGNGTGPAEFHLMGGTHSFCDGLRVSLNALLTGCGTINGDLLVEGIVLATCGGALRCAGSVTNYGTIKAISGTVLDFQGQVVNYGLIDAIHGSTNFPAGIINNGIVLDANGDYDGDRLTNLQEDQAGTSPTNAASAFRVIATESTGDDFRITWTAVGGKSYIVQTNATPEGTGFADLSATIHVDGCSETTTNYLPRQALGRRSNAAPTTESPHGRMILP